MTAALSQGKIGQIVLVGMFSKSSSNFKPFLVL